MGTMIKAMSFGEIIKNATEKAEKSLKEFEENGGICLNCGKAPGEKDSSICPLHCVECNAKAEELLKQLRGPGFMEIR